METEGSPKAEGTGDNPFKFTGDFMAAAKDDAAEKAKKAAEAVKKPIEQVELEHWSLRLRNGLGNIFKHVSEWRVH